MSINRHFGHCNNVSHFQAKGCSIIGIGHSSLFHPGVRRQLALKKREKKGENSAKKNSWNRLGTRVCFTLAYAGSLHWKGEKSENSFNLKTTSKWRVISDCWLHKEIENNLWNCLWKRRKLENSVLKNTWNRLGTRVCFTLAYAGSLHWKLKKKKKWKLFKSRFEIVLVLQFVSNTYLGT